MGPLVRWLSDVSWKVVVVLVACIGAMVAIYAFSPANIRAEIMAPTGVVFTLIGFAIDLYRSGSPNAVRRAGKSLNPPPIPDAPPDAADTNPSIKRPAP